MRSVFAIRRDTPVDSKVYYHPVFALSQCAQIIDRYKFFLFTTRAPQSNLDYNLGQNRMEQQTPIPNQDQSTTKPHKSPNGPFFPSLGVGAAYTQSSVTVVYSLTFAQQLDWKRLLRRLPSAPPQNYYLC